MYFSPKLQSLFVVFLGKFYVFVNIGKYLLFLCIEIKSYYIYFFF